MPRTVTLVVALLIASLSFDARAGSDEPTERIETMSVQNEIIGELRSEVERLRQEQQQSEDRLLAIEDQMAAEESVSPAVAAYLEKGIEAYERAPVNRLFLSGYGTASLVDTDDRSSEFVASFNPIFHFRLTDRLHFMGELEIGVGNLDGANETEVELEYAQIDYFVNDWMTASAGKFFVPFNTFGPKLHPQWINKLASMPPIYGGHGTSGLIPLLSEAGTMVSGGVSLFNTESTLSYAISVVNAPSFELGPGHAASGAATAGDTHAADDHDPVADDHDPVADDHDPVADDHDPVADDHDPVADDHLTTLATDTVPASASNHDNIAIGGRIGFLPIPKLELGTSFLAGRASGSNNRFSLMGFDAWYSLGDLQLRGEFAQINRRSGHTIPDGSGYWLQASYRNREPGSFLSRVEPVIRWGVVGGTDKLDQDQLAVGLNYWLFESAPIKLTYEFNSGELDKDRFLVQFAYGF